jgi:hypothetical protein
MEYLDDRDSFGKVIKFLIFWIFDKKIPRMVQTREPLKAKKLKIRVTRKPDLKAPN